MNAVVRKTIKGFYVDKGLRRKIIQIIFVAVFAVLFVGKGVSAQGPVEQGGAGASAVAEGQRKVTLRIMTISSG